MRASTTAVTVPAQMKGAMSRIDATAGVSIRVTAVPKATRIEAGNSRAALTTVTTGARRATKPSRPPTAPPSRAIEMIEWADR